MSPRVGPKKPVRVFLEEWRKHRRMTQEQVGSLIGPDGVGKSTISRWENAKRLPNVNILAAYAEAIGVTVGDLYRQPIDGPSLDAMAADLDPETRRHAVEYVSLLRRERSA
jgi:transcriptional regulator with XRE-family HTH domain